MVPKAGEGTGGRGPAHPERAAPKRGSLWKPGCLSGGRERLPLDPWALGARLSRGNLRAPGKCPWAWSPRRPGAQPSLGKQLFSKCLELSWKQAEYEL